MRLSHFMLAIFIMVIQSLCVAQQSFYIAVNGSDSNPGTEAQPFATIAQAQAAVRAVNGSMTSNITVFIRGGKYFFDSTIEFDERDSGKSENARVIYKAYPGEVPVLCGGSKVTGWTVHSGNIYKANIGSKRFRFLMEGDHAGILARTPNEGSYYSVASHTPWTSGGGRPTISWNPGEFAVPFSDTATLDAWTGYWYYNWFRLEFDITDVDFANNTLTYSAPNYHGGLTDQIFTPNRYLIENDLTFLDSPGEFFLDETTDTLYYWPHQIPAGAQDVVVAEVDTLLQVVGSSMTNLAKYITFEGLHLMLSDEPLYASHTFGETAMISFENTEHMDIRFCKIMNAGCTGVLLNKYCQNNTLYGNWLENIGFFGIRLRGYPHGEGPFSNLVDANVNKNHRIENNYIYAVGERIPYGVGIQIWQSGSNLIAHNEVSRGPRFGISMGGWREKNAVGDGSNVWWGVLVTPDNFYDFNFAANNLIQYNDVIDVLRDSQDAGGIYGWGPGKYNVVNANRLHDYYGRIYEYYNSNGKHISIVGVHNDDDFDYCTISSNMVFNWNGELAYKNNGNKFVDYINNMEVANEVEAEYQARLRGIPWDLVGLKSDFPWTIQRPAPVADLLLHYPFDEGAGSTATDQVGNADGSLQGTAHWVTGQIGGALDFDGSLTVNIPVQTINNGIDRKGETTLAFWVNENGRGYVDAPFVVGLDSSGNPIYRIQVGYNNQSKWECGYGPEPVDGTIGGDSISVSDKVFSTSGWHHWAFVKSNERGEMYIYHNGRAVQYTPHGGKRRPMEDVGSFQLGRTGFQGAIDDLRVYSNALSGTQIWNLYADGLAGSGNPIADIKLDSAVGTVPHRVTFNAFFSIPSQGAEITAYILDPGDGTAAITNATPVFHYQYGTKGKYTATLTVTDDSGKSDTETAEVKVLVPINGDLLLHYSFDETAGSVVQDLSGNGFHGHLDEAYTVGGAMWQQAGALTNSGTALDLNQAVIPVTNATDLLAHIEDELTIAVWVKDQGQSSGTKKSRSRAIVHAPKVGGGNAMNVFFSDDDSVGMEVEWSAGSQCKDIAYTNENQWVHWAFVKDLAQSRMAIYRNGDLFKESLSSSAAIGEGEGFAVGGIKKLDGNIWYPFPGMLDDLQVYKTALTQTEIKQIVMKGNTVASKGYAKWQGQLDWKGAANGALDNPDGDRYSNFLEYAFDLDPLVANSDDYMPKSYPHPDGVNFAYEFRNKQPDVKYVVQVSNDLQTWPEEWIVDQTQTMPVMIGISSFRNGKMFIRLKVEEK